jgi:hypothetical protein
MNRNSPAARFRNWMAEIRQFLEAAKSEPAMTDSPEWYAGLAVSPASFSGQLGELQTSLLRANTQQPAKAAAGKAAAEQIPVRARRIA